MDFAGKSPASVATMITGAIYEPGYKNSFIEDLIVKAIQHFSNSELERRRYLEEENKRLRADVLAVWTPRPRLAKLLGVEDLPADEQMHAAEKRIESLLADEARLNFEVAGVTVRDHLDSKVIAPSLKGE